MNETQSNNLTSKLVRDSSRKANETQEAFVKDRKLTMDLGSEIEYKAPAIADNAVGKNSFSTTNLGSISMINPENTGQSSQMTNAPRSTSVLKAMSLAQLIQNKK